MFCILILPSLPSNTSTHVWSCLYLRASLAQGCYKNWKRRLRKTTETFPGWIAHCCLVAIHRCPLWVGQQIRFISCSFVGTQGQAKKISILTILPTLRNSFSLRMFEDEVVDRQRRERGSPHAGRELTDKLCIECMVYTYSVHMCSLPFIAFQLWSDEPS